MYSNQSQCAPMQLLNGEMNLFYTTINEGYSTYEYDFCFVIDVLSITTIWE